MAPLSSDRTQLESGRVDAITPEQLERATQQVLDESDLASIKHNLGMGIVTSAFMVRLPDRVIPMIGRVRPRAFMGGGKFEG